MTRELPNDGKLSTCKPQNREVTEALCFPL